MDEVAGQELSISLYDVFNGEPISQGRLKLANFVELFLRQRHIRSCYSARWPREKLKSSPRNPRLDPSLLSDERDNGRRCGQRVRSARAGGLARPKRTARRLGRFWWTLKSVYLICKG